MATNRVPPWAGFAIAVWVLCSVLWLTIDPLALLVWCVLSVVGAMVYTMLPRDPALPTPDLSQWARELHELNDTHEQARVQQAQDWASRGVLVVADPCLTCLRDDWRVPALPGAAECKACWDKAWKDLCHDTAGLLGKERRWRREGIPV